MDDEQASAAARSAPASRMHLLAAAAPSLPAHRCVEHPAPARGCGARRPRHCPSSEV
jgi:hypothetical protein